MQNALVSLVLSGLGGDALKVGAGLALAVVLALAFAVASLAAVFVAPAGLSTALPASGAGRVISGSPSPLVVEIARTQVGKPYVWGGAWPEIGFDCSGLVQWAHRQVGIALPRTAQQQFNATARISPEQIRPGDLVFFAYTNPLSVDPVTHVGIYVGHGWMVNAPDDGDVVREMPVFTGFWGAHYAGAGRVRR